MSTAGRKARKRAGIKFERTPKVPTPVEERTETKKAAEALARRAKRQTKGNAAAAAKLIEASLRGGDDRKAGA